MPVAASAGLHHLKRHDLGQLTQMTRGEHATSYRDLPGDDTLVLQCKSPSHRLSAATHHRGVPLLYVGPTRLLTRSFLDVNDVALALAQATGLDRIHQGDYRDQLDARAGSSPR